MPSVLAWIVAIERHTSGANGICPLDFQVPVSRRALEWAEWLAQQADTRLLLNIAVAPGSQERQRVAALAPQALNAAQAHLATSAALHEALTLATTPPVADVLLLLWIGHGVLINEQRFALIEDSLDAEHARSWDIGSLLKRLRSGEGPGLQIGAFDTCAQELNIHPGSEDLGGAGGAARQQHFYFAASAGFIASPNPSEESLASIVLDALKAVPWPPEPASLFTKVKPRADRLPSQAVPLEWTAGSGELRSRGGTQSDADAELARVAREAAIGDIFFRHLWKALQGGPRTPAELGRALQAQRLDAFVDTLRAEDANAAEALQVAAARVRRVEPWIVPLARLHLRLAHWSNLAQQVASSDGRTAPGFAELRQLLLWTVDMAGVDAGGSARGDKALLELMVLAGREAQRSVPDSAAAVADLRARLQASPDLAPLLPQADAAAQLPQRPLVLLVELQMRQDRPEPKLGKHWLLHDDRLEPGSDLEDSDLDAGDQLMDLIDTVQRSTGRVPRVELLAPTELLCGDRQWVSYSFDGTDVAQRIDIDTLVPVYWRWRDRMKGTNPRVAQGTWRQRALDAQQRAAQRQALSCRFDDEPAAAQPPDFLGFVARPPRPNEQGQRRAAFLNALVQGHPYMLWPAVEAVDPAALKARVTEWLGQQTFQDLPEGYANARSRGLLPNLVLFLDEPERNPYPQLTRLRPIGAVA
jgi:hypothetical protein